MKGLGFHAEDFKITGFDVRDAMVGRSVAYEFEVEVDKKVLPFKLLEDVNRWEYVDLPIFRIGETLRSNEENGLVERRPVLEPAVPVLAPFQLAGPMELWIHDAKDMRLSLPVSFISFLILYSYQGEFEFISLPILLYDRYRISSHPPEKEGETENKIIT